MSLNRSREMSPAKLVLPSVKEPPAESSAQDAGLVSAVQELKPEDPFEVLGQAVPPPDVGGCSIAPSARTPRRSLDLTSALVEEATENSSVPVQQGTTEEIKEQKKADILEHVIADDFEDTLPPAKPPRQLTLEPDIVASTKRPGPVRPPPQAGGAPPRPPPPARPAPPPRKKKSDLGVESQRPSALEVPSDTVKSIGLVSPNTAVECITKDLQHSLDLASATSGDKVVTAQVSRNSDFHSRSAVWSSVPSDTVKSIGLVSPNTAIECITKDLQHSLDLASATSGDKVVTAQENGKAADGQSSTTDGSEASGPQRPRSNSGRELTDEEILASVMIKNLDTGEEIPLSLAEEKLPTGINPLTLHIMRRTKEYVTSLDLTSALVEEATENSSVPVQQGTTEEIKEQKKADILEHVIADDFEDTLPPAKPPRQLTLEPDIGAVWTMKFSHCGRLLATAGQDKVVRIWVLKNAFDYFNNMRMKYNTEGRVSPSPSQESLNSSKSETDTGVNNAPEDPDLDDKSVPFRQQPFCKYKGHTADLLDLSWSKDDRYFLSGSLDGKLRLWNIPDKKVALWNEVDGQTRLIWSKKVALWNEVDGQTRLITAANFCQNGKYAVIGTYDGRCIFYDTEHLKYHTQIHVRSTRGRNRVGRKITGIEPLPGENKILVTSNDSRIRLYDLRDLSLSMKYKGYVNSSSQIKASFSHNYSYIISGSEDRYVYIWSTYHDLSKFTSVRRDRNDFWEGIKAHNAVVTSAIFAPNPSLIVSAEPAVDKPEEEGKSPEVPSEESLPSGALKSDHTEVLLSADFTGAIKVFINRKKKE
ncbi:UNVERIFIED_CONTAM: hypothetical protein FKN15_001651 [Acipenser sinensis]